MPLDLMAILTLSLALAGTDDERVSAQFRRQRLGLRQRRGGTGPARLARLQRRAARTPRHRI